MEKQEIKFHISPGILASLHCDPQQFIREMRLAAAVKWYENGDVSQGRAAEIADLSRAEFIAALERFGVSPFQESAQELVQEVQETTGETWK